MKSRINLTKIALLLFLTYSSSSLCQTHNIVLEVDTEKVICGEVEKYTKFKGQADGQLNKDFTVEVDKGDKIAWQAVDISSKNRRVVVKQIRYESGDRLFKNDKLKSRKLNLRSSFINSGY